MIVPKQFVILIIIICTAFGNSNANSCKSVYSGLKGKSAPITSDKAWISDAVKQHNVYRRKHSAPDLTYSEELTKISQYWANHLAATKGFEHSPGHGLGENLGMSGSTAPGFKMGANKAVDMWYNEIKDYDFKSGKSKNNKPTGHFTQVVWKGSSEVGIAYASYKEGGFTKFVVVANYCPPGNFVGRYQQNVSK